MIDNPVFAAYDLETTGIHHEYNEIIEFAIILLDYNLKEVDRFIHKVLPDYENRVHHKARAINGYNRDEWKKQGAINQVRVAFKLEGFFNKYEINKPLINIGHNIKFDMNFISVFMRKNGVKFPLDHRRNIDTVVLEEVIRMLKYKNKGGQRKTSPKNFDGLMEKYGVVALRINGKHNAESDIDATLEILRMQLVKCENGFRRNVSAHTIRRT